MPFPSPQASLSSLGKTVCRLHLEVKVKLMKWNNQGTQIAKAIALFSYSQSFFVVFLESALNLSCKINHLLVKL